MVSFAHKLKMLKTCEKRFYKHIRVVLCKKTSILQRLLPMQRVYPLQNGRFGLRAKNAKNTGKTILQGHWSIFVRKTARKNTQYWRKETFLKIGHLAKAIAHVKAIAFAIWSVWVKN